MIADIHSKYYGLSHSANYFRELCKTSKDGVSLLDISDAAEKIGFRTMGAAITWNQLLNEANLPAIVYWNQQHFIVVYKVTKQKVFVSDPAIGRLTYSRKEFVKHWQCADDESLYGVILMLSPSTSFNNEDEEKSKGLGVRKIFFYVFSFKQYIIQLCLNMFVACVLESFLPFTSQSIVDGGIGNSNLSFIMLVLVAQVTITLGQTINNLIRNWLMLHMTTRLSVNLISDFLQKIMSLPIAFFDSKNIGDILQRIGDYGRIQSFLTETLLSMIIAIFMFIVYGCIMASYSLKIIGVFLLGSLIYVSWVLIFMRMRRKLDYKRFQSASNNQSCLIQLVTGIQDIKLNNCERRMRWDWERIQVQLFRISMKGLTINQIQSVGGVFIDQIKNVVISYIAASSVVNGNITLGMMTAILYIIGQLNAPISQFISFIQESQDAAISMERLNDVYSKESEETDDMTMIKEIPNSPTIEFKNVSYQYGGQSSEFVLKNIDLVIPPNRITAIVGPSGSGKTTLLKMILGFYKPVH